MAFSLLHLCPPLLAQDVDRDLLAFHVQVPEGPAIARRRPLKGRPHLVDRATIVAIGPARDQGAVSAHLRTVALAWPIEESSWLQQASLHQRSKGNPRSLSSCLDLNQTGIRQRFYTCNPFPRDRKSTRLNSSHVANSYAVF